MSIYGSLRLQAQQTFPGSVLPGLLAFSGVLHQIGPNKNVRWRPDLPNQLVGPDPPHQLVGADSPHQLVGQIHHTNW